MKSAKRILLSSATIFECLKLIFAFQQNIPTPERVYPSAPSNQYRNIQWPENTNYKTSTCATYTSYDTETVKKVKKKLYGIYILNLAKYARIQVAD